MSDNYIYGIVALLPLAAFVLTIQVNPYHALVIRGILGAVAALVYAVLGAADVALTEALVGTLLAITLYAVAVRSSLVLRVGVLKDKLLFAEAKLDEVARDLRSRSPITDLQTIAGKYHLRLELEFYLDSESLHQALLNKEVHAVCIERSHLAEQSTSILAEDEQPYRTVTRIRRLYEIFQSELPAAATSLAYFNPSEQTAVHHQEKHS